MGSSSSSSKSVSSPLSLIAFLLLFSLFSLCDWHWRWYSSCVINGLLLFLFSNLKRRILRYSLDRPAPFWDFAAEADIRQFVQPRAEPKTTLTQPFFHRLLLSIVFFFFSFCCYTQQFMGNRIFGLGRERDVKRSTLTVPSLYSLIIQ